MGTCLNSSGDTVASMIISRMVEGKGWMDKKSERKTDPEKLPLPPRLGAVAAEPKNDWKNRCSIVYNKGAIIMQIKVIGSPGPG